jgi:hypothetical protein
MALGYRSQAYTLDSYCGVNLWYRKTHKTTPAASHPGVASLELGALRREMPSDIVSKKRSLQLFLVALFLLPAALGLLLQQVTTLSVPRSGLSCGTIAGHMVFAGGDVGSNTSTSDVTAAVDTLTPPFSGARWTNMLAASRSAMSGCSVNTSVGEFVAFAGGIHNATAALLSNVIDVLSQVSGTNSVWDIKTLAVPRAFIGCAAVGEQILFAGGVASPTAPLAFIVGVIEIFTPATGSVVTAPVQLSQARFTVAAASVGTLAIFAGGDLDLAGFGRQTSDVVDIWDAGVMTATTLSASRTMIASAALTVGSESWMLFAGGQATGGVPLDVVDIFTVSSRVWPCSSCCSFTPLCPVYLRPR